MMMLTPVRTLTALLLAGACFTLSAAMLSPADRDAVRQQQQQILDQNQQQRDELERSTALPSAQPPRPVLPSAGPCFRINTLRLTGVTLISPITSSSCWHPGRVHVWTWPVSASSPTASPTGISAGAISPAARLFPNRISPAVN
ncbi:hypothetical protein [Pseudomonas graminis]